MQGQELLDELANQTAHPSPHPVDLYLSKLAPGSHRTIKGALKRIADLASNGQDSPWTLDWSQLSYQRMASVRSSLASSLAPASVNKALAALRGVLREAWQLGQITAENYHRAASLPPIKSQTFLKGRALAQGELRSLMACCAADKTPAGIRDAALLSVLYGTGVRRSEAVALDLEDYEPDKEALKVRAGKGRKDRVVFVTSGTASALKDWILLRGEKPGALFWPVFHDGTLIKRRLVDQAVIRIARKRGAQAGLERFSPHDLRRSYISDLLEAGADLSTVQRLAGHASVQTTTRYDLRGEEAKRKASRLLHVPYFKPGTGT